MAQGTDVLGQARTAKREPGLEVCGRNIELRVCAKDFNHRFRIDVQFLSERSRPSLAKATLSACHELQTYFTISAEVKEVSKTRPGAQA